MELFTSEEYFEIIVIQHSTELFVWRLFSDRIIETIYMYAMKIKVKFLAFIVDNYFV